MKTPEEIKKGLECALPNSCNGHKCSTCPNATYSINELLKGELIKDALAYIQQLESSRWELFEDLSAAYYGKVMYGLNNDGTVYSRYSCDTMSFEQAVDEFTHLLYKENE